MMNYLVCRSLHSGGAEEYCLIPVPDTGASIVRDSFTELMQDLKRLAEKARSERKTLSLSFTPGPDIILHRRVPACIRRPLTPVEQRGVWETVKSVPIPDTL